MRSAWREISRHPRRYAAVLVAIMLSTGFGVGSLVFVATSSHALGVRASERTAAADLVVLPGGAEADWRATTRTLRTLPGVRQAEPVLSTYAAFGGSTAGGYLALDSLPEDLRLRPGRLAEGRWPAAADELAVTAGTARDYGLRLGQTVPVVDAVAERTYPLRVTGVIAEPRTVLDGGGASGVVSLALLAGWDATSLQLVTVEPDRTPDQVAAVVRAELPDAQVQTAAAYAADRVAEVTNGVDLPRMLLLVAGAVALLAGSLIVANSFAILLAQRWRQIALLRAIGASGRDVRRGLRAEALLVGLAGSVAGVGFGLLLGLAAAEVSGARETGLVVPWVQVAAAALAGLVVTFGAAVLPVRRATSIPPLAALAPVPDGVTAARTGRRRAGACAGLVVAGTVLVVATFAGPAASRPFPVPLLLAIAGCALLAVGILAAAPVFLGPVLRGVGRLVRAAPPVVRLAVANAARNPGRTAAGTVALMLAVGLVVTLQVGAASARVSALDQIDREFPVDLAVSNPGGTLQAGLIDRVRAVPGVAAVTPVLGTQAAIGGRAADDGGWPVYGLAPDAGAVVAAGFERVHDDVVLAHPFTLESARLTPGERTTLVVGGRSVTAVVEASDVAAFGGFVTTAATVRRLTDAPPVTQLWLAAADPADPGAVMAGVRQVLAAQPGLQLEGSLEQSATLAGVLDTLLLVATALLGVAALIAVVGVGNTLGLSVLERRRESALLRALGLQRRQLRAVLAVEAVLLALVAAVVGVAAGVLFGAVGAAAMMRELGPLRLSVPAGDVAAVVAVTILAGVLASVLPGRRAAREAPVAALAAE